MSGGLQLARQAEYRRRGSDHIRRLVSGYSSRVKASKLLVILQAYIDDSASDFGEQRLFLAGYINTADKWERFSDAWDEELRRSPSIEYLKMKEANTLSGQFRGWTVTDKDEKIRDLSRLIRHFRPASIHASVSRSDVRKIIQPVAPYGMRSPYFYCFQAVMLPLAIHQSKQHSSLRVPIDFIFDNQDGLGEHAKAIYKVIRSEQPQHISDLLSVEPLFRDDKFVLPLQAADILAWHLRRNAEGGHSGNFPVPDFLSHDGIHMAVDITAADLQRIADGLAQIPDTQLMREKRIWKRHWREAERLLALGFVPPHGTRFKNAVQRARKFLARLIHT